MLEIRPRSDLTLLWLSPTATQQNKTKLLTYVWPMFSKWVESHYTVSHKAKVNSSRMVSCMPVSRAEIWRTKTRQSEKLAQGHYFSLEILVRVLRYFFTVPLLDTHQLVQPLTPLAAFGTMKSQLWSKPREYRHGRHTPASELACPGS